MGSRPRALLLIGLIGFFVFGSQFAVCFVRAYLGDSDNWWTPRSMAVSLEEASLRVRLLVAGKPLQQRLAAGEVFVQDGDGVRPLEAVDVTARLNNWPQTKARILSFAGFTGIALGASLACLVLGGAEALSGRRKVNDAEG